MTRALHPLLSVLRLLRPAPLAVNRREQWRAALGAGLGILLTAWLCKGLVTHWQVLTGAAWIAAPLGASAVLVFAVPGSPLAQPWSVVGGNTLSALVGIAVVRLVPDPLWACALAVTLAIALMFACRCLHPPGGAMALLTSLNHVQALSFALSPAALGSVLLVLVGVGYNRRTGRPYPQPQQSPAVAHPDAPSPRFSPEDLDAVLKRRNVVLDVSRGDLEALVRETEDLAYQRLLGEVHCADIMSREPITVQFGSPLQEAWALMRQHRIKALPVVDRWHKLVGIVTLADFMRQVNLDVHDSLGERLRSFVRQTGGMHSDKPEVVGQIMTRQVRVASADKPIMELVSAFSVGGHHHIPIIDPDKRLVGIITQSDFVRALARAVDGRGASWQDPKPGL